MDKRDFVKKVLDKNKILSGLMNQYLDGRTPDSYEPVKQIDETMLFDVWIAIEARKKLTAAQFQKFMGYWLRLNKIMDAVIGNTEIENLNELEELIKEYYVEKKKKVIKEHSAEREKELNLRLKDIELGDDES